MSRVFIPTCKDKKTGETREGPNYHITFMDDEGVERCVVAFPVSEGKAKSDALAAKLEELVASMPVYAPKSAELLEWLRKMPPGDLQDKLMEWRLIDDCRGFGPISRHVIGYMHELKAKGDDQKHVRLTIRMLTEMVRFCRIHYLWDITTDTVMGFLTALRLQDGAKIATVDCYLAAFDGFFSWLVKKGRMPSSPLATIDELLVEEAVMPTRPASPPHAPLDPNKPGPLDWLSDRQFDRY